MFSGIRSENERCKETVDKVRLEQDKWGVEKQKASTLHGKRNISLSAPVNRNWSFAGSKGFHSTTRLSSLEEVTKH